MINSSKSPCPPTRHTKQQHHFYSKRFSREYGWTADKIGHNLRQCLWSNVYFPSFLQVNHDTITGSAGDTYEVYSSKTCPLVLLLVTGICLIFMLIKSTAAVSTSEKSDQEVRIHLSLQGLLESSVCLHTSMRRRRRAQHPFIFFPIALMHFKMYLHQSGTKKQKQTFLCFS